MMGKVGFCFNLFFYNILVIFTGWNGIYFVESVPAPQMALTSDSPFKMPHLRAECMPSKEEITMFESKIQMCVKKVGNITVSILDENFAKGGYNDQCFSKCVFTEMKFMTEDGEPLEEELLKLVKTAPTLEKERTKMTKDCIKSSKDMVTVEGGIKAVPCKYSAILAVCLMKGDHKICKEEKK